MGKKFVAEASGVDAGSVCSACQSCDGMDCAMEVVEECGGMTALWVLKECLQTSLAYQPRMTNLLHVSSKDKMKVSPVRRNQSAYDLKCLTAFYSYPPDVFCLALSTLDRFITKVKVQPRYLSCITTTCFYHAAKAIQGSENAPSLETLISVSQSDGGCGDIHRMETIICDKLRPAPDEQSVTALSLLRAVIDAFAELTHVDLSGHMTKLSSKLIMCLCHAELLAAPMVMIALAVFGAHLQQLGMDNVQAVAFTTILNICQICDRDFLPYQEHISHFLAENYAAPSSLPKLPLKWKISNRTMWVLRPHYRWDYDLPSIPEAPIDSLDMRTGSVESLNDMEVDEGIPGTPNPDDFSNHFSYPNSPSEPSPISASLPPCHILTYADVVSGRFYHE